MSTLRAVARGGLFILGLLVLPGLLQAAWVRPETEVYGPGAKTSARAEDQYARIRAHLQAPFDGYADPPGLAVSGWKIAALSHMASGLMSLSADAREAGDTARQEQLAALLSEVATRAVRDDSSPYDQPLDTLDDYNDWGFYLGHLSLVLGCARYVTGETTHDLLHRRIVRYQLARMAADGDQHARSYPNSYKWPADQALSLAGAHLYDRIHGTHLAVAPVRAWLDAMDTLSAPTGGLHPAALHNIEALPILSPDGAEHLPPLAYADTPRGSALAPTTFYMAQFAPAEAAALYVRYREAAFRAPLGLGGFAEWPADHPRTWDVEGGPVVLGLGVVATGMSLGPARLFGDPAAYTATLRSTLALGVPVGGDRLLVPLLGEAILLSALTARPWFEPPPELGLSTQDAPAPIGAWLLVLADLALLGGLVVPPLRARWRRPAMQPPPGQVAVLPGTGEAGEDEGAA